MLVVPETAEPYIPLPDDLLARLSDVRPAVDALLRSLPAAFARGGGPESAMGPALQAAFLLSNHIGGKLLLFQAAAASLGERALPPACLPG
jgi:protein transport protein SEC24